MLSVMILALSKFYEKLVIISEKKRKLNYSSCVCVTFSIFNETRKMCPIYFALEENRALLDLT